MGTLNKGLKAWIKANPAKAAANKAKFFTSKKNKKGGKAVAKKSSSTDANWASKAWPDAKGKKLVASPTDIKKMGFKK